ncbi:MAG TPA: inositol monophosphatase family protein [Actinomycetota bacterium]|nr:inositol monophosphatase family protein [Actinomycetota bacterium]
MDHLDLELMLRLALDIARAGGEVALAHYGTSPQSAEKADGTWVTEGDRAAERRMRELLARHVPDHNILGEEEGLSGAGGGTPSDGAPVWILDPIDGTHNYMARIPIWATLVALEVDGRYVAGVAHAPALGETYDAAVGLGARCNGTGIGVSAVSSLDRATVVTPGYEGFDERGLAEFYLRLTRSSWRSRGFGDFWGHVLVARGACEVMVDPIVATWDLAALVPIVEEAGGRITNLSAGDPSGGESLVSTNGALHDRVLDMAVGRSVR